MEEIIYSDKGSEHVENLENNGTWGFAEEKQQIKENRYDDPSRKNPLYDEYNTSQKREEKLNTIYAKLNERFSGGDDAILSVNAYKNVTTNAELYENERRDISTFEKYSQTGLLANIREVSYENKKAIERQANHNTKHTRKRVEKRRQVMEKHRAAVLATSEMTFDHFMRNAYLDIKEADKKAMLELSQDGLNGIKQFRDALKDAEDYETEHNIKMLRVGKKRAIDMGDGTTKFFQNLCRIRTGYTTFKIEELIMQDYLNIINNAPQSELSRLQKKSNSKGVQMKNKRKKLNSDINAIASQIPALIQALNPNESLRSLKNFVRGFKANTDTDKKLTFVNMILNSSVISMSIRKDIHTQPGEADKISAANMFKDMFLEIARNEAEHSVDLNQNNPNEENFESFIVERENPNEASFTFD